VNSKSVERYWLSVDDEHGTVSMYSAANVRVKWLVNGVRLLQHVITTASLQYVTFSSFLPRDAMQSAVLVRQVVCPSVTLKVSWSHRSEYLKNNFTVC